MSGDIIVQNHNSVFYAYHKGRFWRWDDARNVWKESHLMAAKFERARAALKTLTPEVFFSDGAEFALLDEYEIPLDMAEALKNAKPCKNAPIEPVEEDLECATAPNADAAATTAESAVPNATAATPTTSESGADASALTQEASPQGCESGPAASVEDSSAPLLSKTGCAPQDKPAAPTFDFGADDQTNALLLQDAQTFITGNMARIMAAKHAHDLCANNKNGTWGKWCDVVGISRDTGDNMVHIAEQFGNIQIDGQSIFDVRPMKLLYAAAKPSTPEVVKQAVFTGDITTYKEYQELMAQFKAEKERADTAEHQLEAANADITGLTEQNTQLQKNYNEANDARVAARLQCQKAEAERDKAQQRAKTAESQLSGSRQVAEAAKLRTDKLKAENDALKKQPIEAVVDEEEVDRRASKKAYEIAAGMTADYKTRQEQDARDAYDGILLAGRTITNAWQAAKLLFAKLPTEQREPAANQLIHTLGQIQGEVSACL